MSRVDGFIHKRFNDSYKLLIYAAIEWGQERNATRFAARVCAEDIEKRALFDDFGFQTGPIDGTFTISEREGARSVDVARVGQAETALKVPTNHCLSVKSGPSESC